MLQELWGLWQPHTTERPPHLHCRCLLHMCFVLLQLHAEEEADIALLAKDGPAPVFCTQRGIHSAKDGIFSHGVYAGESVASMVAEGGAYAHLTPAERLPMPLDMIACLLRACDLLNEKVSDPTGRLASCPKVTAQKRVQVLADVYELAMNMFSI